MAEKSYQEGYYDGVIAALQRVDKWIDPETLYFVREELLK